MSILYQNEDKTLILLDIPRSIELAQGTSGEPLLRRLISCNPLDKPFPSLEPKSAKAKAKLGETPIKSLLLQRHIQFALEDVKKQHTGPWCLPRIVPHGDEEPPLKKRKAENPKPIRDKSSDAALSSIHSSTPEYHLDENTVFHVSKTPEFYQNGGSSTTTVLANSNEEMSIYVPPNSTFVNRFITGAESFLLPNGNKFPDKNFNLILLDPPWPNRSVHRKANYSISSSTSTIQSLLSCIPIHSLLAPEGIVALWITNKPTFHDMILESRGIFEQWGIELIEEWVWVKITKDGEPMSEITGSWRKPYEVLLVGRKIPADRGKERSSETGEEEAGIKRRVIFAVPDIHSRKPNLKELFEKSALMPNSEKYEALEIFARNMTAGWWAWGNEVVEFQKEDHWVLCDSVPT